MNLIWFSFLIMWPTNHFPGFFISVLGKGRKCLNGQKRKNWFTRGGIVSTTVCAAGDTTAPASPCSTTAPELMMTRM